MVQFAKGLEYPLRHDTTGAGLKSGEKKKRKKRGGMSDPADFSEAMVSAI